MLLSVFAEIFLNGAYQLPFEKFPAMRNGCTCKENPFS
ncbi:hypothetical protein CAter282_2901 [Collimonas arenae]|uniref:Uncharacterized protein n=1 Tax=Collimonas arenae TaxID=279058 RepID=A0A127PSL0_9BURK|nr:hypothetical protein CAter10_3193 [Collimonas arenae]AMP10625.1 hypothetical protein CAter282_2901 [Collimonas arenae]